MGSNVLTVQVVFNSNDMNKENLKKCIWLIRGVMQVYDLDDPIENKSKQNV